MTSIIKIDFNDNHEPIVSARELHGKLGIAMDFTGWFKYQANKLEIEEGQDFCSLNLGSKNGGSGGHNKLDYILTLTAAKELCMASGGKNAKAIRLYFIQVEKAWNSPEQVMARAIQISHAMLQQKQEKIEQLLPKAEMHDLFLAADNAQPMKEVADAVGVGRNTLFRLLREKKILTSQNIPYRRYLDRGYFQVIEKTIEMGGQVINKPQTYVTPKGIDYIGRLITQGGAVNVGCQRAIK